MATPVLELVQVTKTYTAARGMVTALHQVDVSVQAGELLAVRGPSGCGKSSLLLTAGGLLRPDQGTVKVMGHDLYRLSAAERTRQLARCVGFVFQQFHLVPYLNVWENVVAPCCGAGHMVQQQVARTADDLLDRFGLSERRAHRPHELSVGERQRVAMARALIQHPPLLLADEPTGNLDPANSRMLLAYLRAYCDEGGAVLMVTHHPTDSTRIDRTLEMAAGQIAPSLAFRS